MLIYLKFCIAFSTTLNLLKIHTLTYHKLFYVSELHICLPTSISKAMYLTKWLMQGVQEISVEGTFMYSSQVIPWIVNMKD